MTQIKIQDLKYNLSTKVVESVNWTASLTEGDISVHQYGSVDLASISPNDPSFIEWQNLTEEVVIAWLDNVYEDNWRAKLEESLTNDLNKKKSIQYDIGLPW